MKTIGEFDVPEYLDPENGGEYARNITELLTSLATFLQGKSSATEWGTDKHVFKMDTSSGKMALYEKIGANWSLKATFGSFWTDQFVTTQPMGGLSAKLPWMQWSQNLVRNSPTGNGESAVLGNYNSKTYIVSNKDGAFHAYETSEKFKGDNTLSLDDGDITEQDINHVVSQNIKPSAMFYGMKVKGSSGQATKSLVCRKAMYDENDHVMHETIQKEIWEATDDVDELLRHDAEMQDVGPGEFFISSSIPFPIEKNTEFRFVVEFKEPVSLRTVGGTTLAHECDYEEISVERIASREWVDKKYDLLHFNPNTPYKAGDRAIYNNFVIEANGDHVVTQWITWGTSGQTWRIADLAFFETWKGVFDPLVTYNSGDIISATPTGNIYMCISQTPISGADMHPEDGKYRNNWINRNLTRLAAFEGASATQSGKYGLVPPPAFGEKDNYLRGDGLWSPITTSSQVDPHSQTKEYTSGNRALYFGILVEANGAIPANASFAWGTTGSTWKPVLSEGSWLGAFSDTQAYSAGDVVCVGATSKLYRAIDALAASATVHPETGLHRWRWVHYTGGATQQVMVGATDSLHGQQGVMPAPNRTDRDCALHGDGTYKYVIINPHSQTLSYPAGRKALYFGILVEAVSSIPANASFSWGMAGSTWKPVLSEGAWKGVFSASTAYNNGDVVCTSSTSKLYRAMASTPASANSHPETGSSRNLWAQYTGGATQQNMVGATASLNGQAGLCRAPTIAERSSVWLGSGNWTPYPLSVIGNDTYLPNHSLVIGSMSYAHPTVLDLQSTTKGFMVPRMTKAQREAISTASTPNALMVYQTDDVSGLWIYQNGSWRPVIAPSTINVPRGWDITKAYATTDVVTIRGIQIEPNDAIPANTAFAWGTSGATWKPVLSSGENWKGVWNSALDFAIGDLVASTASNQILYRCVTATYAGQDNNPVTGYYKAAWVVHTAEYLPVYSGGGTSEAMPGLVPSYSPSLHTGMYLGSGGWNHPDITMKIHDYSKSHRAGEQRYYRQYIVQANGNINAAVNFAWGTSGNTWKPAWLDSGSWKGVYSSASSYSWSNVVAGSDGELYFARSNMSAGADYDPVSGKYNSLWAQYSPATIREATPAMTSIDGLSGILPPAPSGWGRKKCWTALGYEYPMQPSARLFTTVNQSIPNTAYNGTATEITLDNSDNSDPSLFVYVPNGIRCVKAGLYRVSISVVFDASSGGGFRRLQLTSNGTVIREDVRSAWNTMGVPLAISETFRLGSDAVLRTRAIQSSGSSSLNLVASTSEVRQLSVAYIGD